MDKRGQQDSSVGSQPPQNSSGITSSAGRQGYHGHPITLLACKGPSRWHCKGHFTHEPRAVTMTWWEPKGKCAKAILRHLRNHVVWSRILKCGVKPYVTGPSTKYYFNEFLFVRVLTHDEIEWINGCEHLECRSLPVLVRPTSNRWFLKIFPVTMKHDPVEESTKTSH